MCKFIKVARWPDLRWREGEHTDFRFESDCVIRYINIDSVYKVFAWKVPERISLYRFNFCKFFGANVPLIDDPTVIITYEEEIYFHPSSVDEFFERPQGRAVEINPRFTLLDFGK